LQGETKYPLNTLYGAAIRHTLSNSLVAPVKMVGDHVHVFRVVWRATGDRLEHAWDAVVSQRHLCDEVVARTPALQMFVSCISGVVGKSREATRCIYPAVNYWAAFDTKNRCCHDDIEKRMLAVCSSADVKPIKSIIRRQMNELVTADSHSLFVVLKDHNSRFVYQKMRRSVFAGGATYAPLHPPNAKLVAQHHSKYLPQLPAAVATLKLAGLCIHLEVLNNE